MDEKYTSEYEAGRKFIIGEYKKKMQDTRELYGDDEFKMFDGDFTHTYFQNLKVLGEERDAKIAALKKEFDNKK